MLNKNGFDASKERKNEFAQYAENVDWEKWEKEGPQCKPKSIFYADISQGSEEKGFMLLFGTVPMKFSLHPGLNLNQNGEDPDVYAGLVHKEHHLREGDLAIGKIRSLLKEKKIVLASTCRKLDVFELEQMRQGAPQIDNYKNNYFCGFDSVMYDREAGIKEEHVYLVYGIDEDRHVVKLLDPLSSGEKEVTFEAFRHHFSDVRAGD